MPKKQHRSRPGHDARIWGVHRNRGIVDIVTTAEETVREFWRLMGTNEFSLLNRVLATEFVLEWPQSNERIRGPENFVRMNSEYPALGPWRFTIQHLVANSREVVTQVAITDGEQSALAISFFQVADGRVTRLVEYWPEAYSPPANRKHLTEPLDPTATLESKGIGIT